MIFFCISEGLWFPSGESPRRFNLYNKDIFMLDAMNISMELDVQMMHDSLKGLKLLIVSGIIGMTKEEYIKE